MDTATPLYPHIYSFENLYLAYRQARQGKRGKAPVADFEFNQEEELLRLRDELVSQTWQPGPYHSFYIHEPKRRLISAAPFRDRVVHHALCNLLEPLWERRFISDSYANRVGKGTHRAILRCQGFARRYAYVLQCDLEQFFPSIDHTILRTALARLIPDPETLNLVDRILASGVGVLAESYAMRWFPGDDPSTGSGQGLFAALRPRGLPIGNLTSQFWANVYLNSFDHFVKRELRCPAYLRYVDDFLLFAGDKATLWRWRSAIQERLARLRLTLHPPQVYPVVSGIPFLGFRIYPTHRRLKRRRGIAFQRRFRELYHCWQAGEVQRQQLDASARSWAAHAAWGDTYGLRRAVLGRYVLSTP
ncbi:MAG TPA: reverse transcriptase domain-containing protein [Anaerolineales bacterium]|nr:reverse transcriptase domain-containing protein [Anaerolineales bacterium]